MRFLPILFRFSNNSIIQTKELLREFFLILLLVLGINTGIIWLEEQCFIGLTLCTPFYMYFVGRHDSLGWVIVLTYLTSILWLKISETGKDGQVGFHSNMREWVQKMEFSCKKTHPPRKKKKKWKSKFFFFKIRLFLGYRRKCTVKQRGIILGTIDYIVGNHYLMQGNLHGFKLELQ